jgi:arsenical pump membrane protein
LNATVATCVIAGLATSAVVVRPWRLPEATWAVAGGLALLALGLVPMAEVGRAVAKGTDVYLFLVGMMMAAELAREEGVFDWLASHAAHAAKGSPQRLFVLTYAVGLLVTVFLSNDATAVVLTPAVYTAAKAAKAEPLPYLLICAFIANAASFVLPISNPANIVVFREGMPSLPEWLKLFAVPSVLAIAATFAALWFCQRRHLAKPLAREVPASPLTFSGMIVALGIAAMASVLIAASAAGADLGWPTFAAGSAIFLVVSLVKARAPWQTLREISWGVVPLVAGLFVLVEAVSATGVLDTLTHTLAAGTETSPRATAAAAGIIAAFASNLMNNLPVGLLAGSTTSALHAPPIISAATLIGVDLGPNLSVTGSLATILWLAALRREGMDMSGWQFLKIGAVVMPPALLLALTALLI